jgi:hypothetical protein
MRAWLWALVLIVLAAAAGMACGGGGGDGEATPTPDRPTLEAWLTEIQLKTEDLPDGFGDPDESFTENQQAAENDPEGPTKGLERLESWGRLLGYDATFLVKDTMGTFTKGGTALVVSSISIFADEQGAIQAMQWGRDLLADPADAETLIPNVSGLEGGPISFASVGDETVAAEFTGTTQPEGVPIKIEFTADIVVIREGKGVAYIAVGAIGGAKPGPEVEQLIRILDERMARVLE